MTGDPLSMETKDTLYQDILKSFDQDQSDNVNPIDRAIESWKKARKQIINNDVEIDNFGNCYFFAFDNAVATLKNRQKIYTKDQLIEWVKNQDEVFAQCKYKPNVATSDAIDHGNIDEIQNETKVGFWGRIGNFFAGIFGSTSGKNEVLNKIVDKTLDMCSGGKCDFKIKYEGQLQSDYEYQQAAFQYYAGNDFLAEKFFSAIAQNLKHPWSAYAAFSLGRLYVNLYQGSFPYYNTNEDEKAATARKLKADMLLIKAEKQLTAILAVPEYTVMYKSAQELLDYVIGQRNPFALFKKSEDILMTSHDQEVLKKSMSDFADIWDQNSKPIFNDEIMAHGGDMSQWMNIWLNYKPENLDFIKKKYGETKSQPWLVALARYLPIEDKSFSQIEQKINDLPETSLAYWTAHYYVIKKTIDHGDITKAKIMISQLSSQQKSSVIYDYVEDLRMQTSDSISELFSHAQRYIYEVADVYISQKQNDAVSKILFLDNKAKAVFETILPLEKQTDLVLVDNIFPKKQIEFLRLVTLVRAFLLKDFNSAHDVAVVLAKNNASIGNDLNQFINAKTDEEKNYAGTVFMLRYPGIGIGIYDDVLVSKSLGVQTNEFNYLYPRSDYKEAFNYDIERWNYCQPSTYVADGNGDYKEVPTDTQYTGYSLDFAKRIVSEDDRNKAKEEQQKIYNDTPANYFVKTVMDYALTHPKEKSIPEALHIAVMATKLACGGNSETTIYSKKAFQMLYSKYSNNEWTRKTPYHY